MKQTMLKRVTDYVRPCATPRRLCECSLLVAYNAGGVSERLPEIVLPRAVSAALCAVGHSATALSPNADTCARCCQIRVGADYWSRHQDRRPALAARTQRRVCARAQLPVAFRFTGTEVQAAGMWGVTGAIGAIWLVRLDLPCNTGPGMPARSARRCAARGEGAALLTKRGFSVRTGTPGPARSVVGVPVLMRTREPAAY
jgi:hypothetical protein